MKDKKRTALIKQQNARAKKKREAARLDAESREAARPEPRPELPPGVTPDVIFGAILRAGIGMLVEMIFPEQMPPRAAPAEKQIEQSNAIELTDYEVLD